MGKSVSSIADLKPDSKNARKHNQRNLDMIVDALHKVGAARSIVIDEDGVILAGNGVVEAAAEAGIGRVQVVDADGETIVAVRRTGLTDEQKRKLAYYDNRTAEVAEWDAEQIAADLEAGFDFTGMFSEQEVHDLLGQVADAFGDTATDREQQGVGSTWDQVKNADNGLVRINELEIRVAADVIATLLDALTRAYERARRPFYETFADIVIAGVRAVEGCDS